LPYSPTVSNSLNKRIKKNLYVVAAVKSVTNRTSIFDLNFEMMDFSYTIMVV
jgi:hypothetical protein